MRKLPVFWPTMILTAWALFGCATPDPKRLYANKPDDAKLIVRSTGMPMNVEFGVSSSPAACQGFESIGFVRDSGRSVLLPWIADMTDKFNKVPTQQEAAIPAYHVVQVKGYGSWWDRGGGSCGPLVAKFPVLPKSTYFVDFVWSGVSACSLRVSEADGSEERPVSFERSTCPRPY